MSPTTTNSEIDGFTFEVKAEPYWIQTCRRGASDDQREAWNTAAAMGLDPATVYPFLAEPTTLYTRINVQARTRRPFAEVAEIAWPDETSVELSGQDSWATLTAVTVVDLYPGQDLLAEVRRRLVIQGPIGEEAAQAFAKLLAGEAGHASFWLVATLAWTALAAGALWAARLGGWWRPVVAIAGALAAGCLAAGIEAHANRKRSWRDG